MTKRLAIFASGSGSNAQNIIERLAQSGNLAFPCIISDRKDAFVHQRAQTLGVPSFYFPKADFMAGTPIVDFLREQHIDGIVLAGFLLKVSGPILQAYPRKIINIHPALLPKYGGKGMYGHHVHEAVKAAGEAVSGITIHYINERYDEGDIIFQAQCTLAPDDTPDDIARKVQVLEHRHFPDIVAQVFA